MPIEKSTKTSAIIFSGKNWYWLALSTYWPQYISLLICGEEPEGKNENNSDTFIVFPFFTCFPKNIFNGLFLTLLYIERGCNRNGHSSYCLENYRRKAVLKQLHSTIIGSRAVWLSMQREIWLHWWTSFANKLKIVFVLKISGHKLDNSYKPKNEFLW